MPVALYLVATPIGNLEDITLRALRVLRDDVSKIACEDTRQTLKLLNHYNISKPLVSYHEHNETTRTEELLGSMKRGESLALLSDAGTPLISDPGYRLVRAGIDKGFPVVPLPGASALLVALTGAGLPTDNFRFAGFLPHKQGARQKVLEQLVDVAFTTVLYESPHRIRETLADIATVLGDRQMVLARELTKLHEEFLRGAAMSIAEELDRRGSIKGEITLVIGRSNTVTTEGDPVEEVQKIEKELGLDRMSAIKLVAKSRGMAKGDVYQIVSKRLGGKLTRLSKNKSVD